MQGGRYLSRKLKQCAPQAALKHEVHVDGRIELYLTEAQARTRFANLHEQTCAIKTIERMTYGPRIAGRYFAQGMYFATWGEGDGRATIDSVGFGGHRVQAATTNA